MSDSTGKSLISAITAAWNEAIPARIGKPTELSLLALREVAGDGMAGALAVAVTWSHAFAAECSGAMAGAIVCLFKEDEGAVLDALVAGAADGKGSGGRALVGEALEAASQSLDSPLSVSAVQFFDLGVDESRLATMVGDSAWVGTCALTVGDDLQTQALVLYAPGGSLAARTADSAEPAAPPAAKAPIAAAPAAAASRRQPRREEAPKNIDRLLDVELDVVVRFGVTQMPLRDVVRIGVGSMVELDRGVDEPVELFINGRSLARGEVVVVDGYYGVRITEIGSRAERTSLL